MAVFITPAYTCAAHGVNKITFSIYPYLIRHNIANKHNNSNVRTLIGHNFYEIYYICPFNEPALCLPSGVMWSWWRHQIKTFSASLALCAGNSPVTFELTSQRPTTRSFDVFFDLRLNKRLSKQSRGWWFETSNSCSMIHDIPDSVFNFNQFSSPLVS